MTEKHTRDGDWNRTEWKGDQAPSRTVDGRVADTPADAATSDRWVKTEWVGDQGHGSAEPQDPDTMPEGEPGLSGDRHAPSEQHWARGQSREDLG